MDALRSSGMPCRVYGMRGGPEADQVDGNLEYRPRSGDGFVEDLRPRGGWSPAAASRCSARPSTSASRCSRSRLRGQFEQLMNARYLERDGYGLCAEEVDERVMQRFLERARRVRAGPVGLRAGRQLGRAARRSSGSRRGGRGGPQGRAAARRRARPEARVNRAARRGSARPPSAARGRRDLVRPVPDRAGLRRDDLPRQRRTASDRADLRRRAQPPLHAEADGAPRPLRREGDLLLDRPVGRARAGPAARDARGRARDRQPHLHAPDDAAAHGRRRPGRARALPSGGRGVRGSSSRRSTARR